MDVFEALVSNVSINLGGSNGRMAEHSLDASNVCTVGQQVSGKAMTQGVRMNIFHYSCFGRIIFNYSLNTSLGDPQTFTLRVF